MGYVHRTPAWAGPLGAKNRTTYWGVVPLEPGGSSRGLPPHPDEVRPTGTFGDWYDAACGYLWRAEQQDLSLVRMLAGGLLILLQVVGLYPLVQLAASALPGLSTTGPDPRSVLAGAVLLALVWTGWAVYRRRWKRAWELRKAWSWAIHDPRVLELPERSLGVSEGRDIDTDPEMTHPYRARLHVRIEDRPFVGAAFLSSSHTDRVPDAAGAPAARPPDVRAARDAEQGSRTTLIFGAAFLFGIFGLVGALALLREPDKGLVFLAGLGFIGLMCLALLLWHRSGRQRGGRDGAGFAVRVETPSSPRSSGRTVPAGDMVLTLDDGHAHLMPLDSSRPEVSIPVTALISGVGTLLRDGKQWLVLPDGSHVAVTCSDYVGLRDAAADAGIAVLIPGPQPL